MMLTSSLALAASAVLLVAQAATAQLTLAVSPEVAGPGDTIQLQVSGAPADGRLLVFISLDATPTSVGPFLAGRCGEISFELDLNPRGRGPVGLRGVRADDLGNAVLPFPLPERLHPRLDGQTFYFQVVGVEIELNRETLDCSIESEVSNLGSTDIVVPDPSP